MYIKKNLQNQKTPRTSLVSFKNKIESFSRKALLTSMVIGSTFAPIAVADPVPLKNDTTKFVKSDAEMIGRSAVKKDEAESTRKLILSLAIFAVAYDSIILYSIYRRKDPKEELRDQVARRRLEKSKYGLRQY